MKTKPTRAGKDIILEMSESPGGPYGIGGWLALPAIGLAVGPILRITALVQDCAALIGPAIRDLEKKFPGITVAIACDAFINAVMVAFTVVVAIPFFRKKRGAPLLVIVLLLSNLLV